MDPDAVPRDQRWPSAERWVLLTPDGVLVVWQSDEEHRVGRGYSP